MSRKTHRYAPIHTDHSFTQFPPEVRKKYFFDMKNSHLTYVLYKKDTQTLDKKYTHKLDKKDTPALDKDGCHYFPVLLNKDTKTLDIDDCHYLEKNNVPYKFKDLFVCCHLPQTEDYVFVATIHRDTYSPYKNEFLCVCGEMSKKDQTIVDLKKRKPSIPYYDHNIPVYKGFAIGNDSIIGKPNNGVVQPLTAADFVEIVRWYYEPWPINLKFFPPQMMKVRFTAKIEIHGENYSGYDSDPGEIEKVSSIWTKKYITDIIATENKEHIKTQLIFKVEQAPNPSRFKRKIGKDVEILKAKKLVDGNWVHAFDDYESLP